jgi:two-component system CheB/CheR fusion protein
VRRLAEMHDGGSSARSDGPGKGSEFTVRLPAIDPPEIAMGSAPRESSERARDILVVEDNVDACETMRALLEVHGHRVNTANDGIEGLEKASPCSPR